MTAVEIELAPASDTFAADDERWLAQVAGLHEELQREGVSIRSESTPAPGEKGDIPTIIAALGSAGAISALVTVIQSWLSRERTRHLKIRWRSGDETKDLILDGDMDAATMERIARDAMGQTPGT